MNQVQVQVSYAEIREGLEAGGSNMLLPVIGVPELGSDPELLSLNESVV